MTGQPSYPFFAHAKIGRENLDELGRDSRKDNDYIYHRFSVIFHNYERLCNKVFLYRLLHKF